MSNFKKTSLSIEGLCTIEPTVFDDHRGFFMETYSKKCYLNFGIQEEFIQENHSKSKKGVLRGLHFQIKFPQAKLVRVINGAIYDIVVDLRRNSPTYGKYIGIKLSEKNKKMLYIPKGFAHGFLALTDEVDVIYKVTEFYYPDYDRGIIWNDPDIGIQWPFRKYGIVQPIISTKDAKLPRLREIKNPF